MLSSVYKYIVLIIIILICIIVNSYPLDEWQRFALDAVVLIAGFWLGRFAVQDVIDLSTDNSTSSRRDDDANESDRDPDGTPPPEEANEIDRVFTSGLTSHEANDAAELLRHRLTSPNDVSAALLDKIDYLKTVQEVGNDGGQAKMNGNLLKFLTQGTIMIVSVSASTIEGQNLTNKELSRVMENIVGSLSTAKLMSMDGGLTNLSKMCPCSISLMDAHKKFFGGFSSPTAMPHAGAIFYSKIVQDCLPDLRFRVDSFHENPKGEQGKYLLNEIERGLEKLQEPPLVKAIKSLAPPIDSGRKEFEANQMKSGEIEDAYQDAICFSTDLIGKSGSGKVRAVQVDSKTTLNI